MCRSSVYANFSTVVNKFSIFSRGFDELFENPYTAAIYILYRESLVREVKDEKTFPLFLNES